MGESLISLDNTSSLIISETWDQGRLVRLRLQRSHAQGKSYFTPAGRELYELLIGDRRDFTLPFCLSGTPFQLAVWNAVSKTSRGEVISYGQLAQRVGCGSPQAVGQALKANPLPIIVPCHRVVAKRGLGGYSCGVEIKRMLLELEGVIHEDSGY